MRRILIGSILVLIIILLMPSIPAIQQRTFEENTHSDLVEKFKDVDLENIENLEGIKYPVLYYLTTFILCYRFFRSFLLCGIATNFDSWSDVIYPILFLRGYWLCESTELIIEKFERLSQIFGWGWFD